MSTDREWERWGASDPYYGVITRPQYRSAVLDAQAREEFFASGRDHVQEVMQICTTRLDPGFAPKRVLDFGCGVGRLVIPFAALGAEVVGMDVSPSMLAEARRNCDQRGAPGVQLVPSDDTLSAAPGQFDLVHTSIVLQHIEIPRGRRIFEALAAKVRPGGIGALHVTYAWDHHADNYGQIPPPPPPRLHCPRPPWPRWCAAAPDGLVRPGPPPPPPPPPPVASADPEMQMNFYNLSELMFVLQRRGVRRLHTEFTDHAGALGAFIYFQTPA